MSLNPFAPLGATVQVTAGTNASSASASLPGTGGNTVKVYNSGTFPAAIRFGVGSQTAVVGDLVVAPGITEIFGISPATTDVAAFGIGGAPVLYIQRGDGM